MTNHVPGQPYELTRAQFIQFLGAAETYAALLAVFEGHRAQERAFWATLAAFEAQRVFNPFDGYCASQLGSVTGVGQCPLRWEYTSTSGTTFEAWEPREYSTQPAPGYPGEECADLAPPSFTVTIPAERDVPGRYHHDRLASGGTYCD